MFCCQQIPLLSRELILSLGHELELPATFPLKDLVSIIIKMFVVSGREGETVHLEEMRSPSRGSLFLKTLIAVLHASLCIACFL